MATSVGSCACTTAVDIDPIPAPQLHNTVGLDLFVLALLYPTCAQWALCCGGIMLRMSTISVINSRFPLPSHDTISASFASISLKNSSCATLFSFAWYSLWFLVD